jgi:hypothetical protein
MAGKGWAKRMGKKDDNGLLRRHAARDREEIGMALKMSREAWQRGFDAASGERCPYAVGTTEAWSWRSGRIEGAAATASREHRPGSSVNASFGAEFACGGSEAQRQAYAEGWGADGGEECPYRAESGLQLHWHAGRAAALDRMEHKQTPRTDSGEGFGPRGPGGPQAA